MDMEDTEDNVDKKDIDIHENAKGQPLPLRKIQSLWQTCGACPEQYSGWTEDGEEVYIRMRWGYGYVSIGGTSVSGGECLAYCNYVNDAWAGTFQEGDMAEMLTAANILWNGALDAEEQEYAGLN